MTTNIDLSNNRAAELARLEKDAGLMGFDETSCPLPYRHAELLAEALCRVYGTSPGAWELCVPVTGTDDEYDHYCMGTRCGKHLRPNGADHGLISAGLQGRHRGPLVELELDIVHRLVWIINHIDRYRNYEVRALVDANLSRVAGCDL